MFLPRKLPLNNVLIDMQFITYPYSHWMEWIWIYTVTSNRLHPPRLHPRNEVAMKAWAHPKGAIPTELPENLFAKKTIELPNNN